MRKIRPIVAAIALATSSQAFSQAMLEEVIVTATKRAESLQDVPVTVTAFTADTIQEAGIINADDLAVLTPALSINTNFSPFNARMTIRGIGTAQNDPALEPSVGLFVDGVFFGRTGLGASDLTDIERIEVLQGPQGTLYGKNTNAGAISVVTKMPNIEETEGYLEAGVGNYGMGEVTAAASGPLSDTVAYRLSGNMRQRDGYFDNAGGDDLNDADDWNVQGKLLWEATDQLSFLLNATHVERDTTCCGADAIQSESVNNLLAGRGLPSDRNDPFDYDVAVDVDSQFDLESDLISVTIGYDSDWGSITSITAWNDYEYSQSTDADRSQLDIFYIENEQYAGDSISQELRINSELGDSIEYQLGLFYLEQTTERGKGQPFTFIGEDFLTIGVQQDLALPAPLPFLAAPGDFLVADNVWDTETLAVFGQATWHIGDTWHLTGGIRWTDEEKEASLFTESTSTAPSEAILGLSLLDSVAAPVDADFERSTDNVDWLMRLSHDVGDSAMVFISASTGTKSGGFNGVSGGPDGPEDREFDDEETTNYELGIKSTALDNRLRINATAFYTVVENYQQQEQNPTGVGTFVSNEAEIEVSGIDLDVAAQPLPNLTLTAGLLYMHDYDITEGVNKGQELDFTADLTANLGATVVFPLANGGIFARADYMYMNDHQSGVFVEDREVVNGRLGWRNNNWNISVWGKNLTDDEYVSLGAETFSFSGMDAFFLAPPRTYGATLRYDF